MAEAALRRVMWEEEVVRLLAAVAGSLGVRGVTGYETPAERLAAELADATEQEQPGERVNRRRLEVIATDGEVG